MCMWWVFAVDKDYSDRQGAEWRETVEAGPSSGDQFTFTLGDIPERIVRGLHAPSVRVLRSVAEALDLSAETLLEQAGLLEDANNGNPTTHTTPPTERAIRIDPRLSEPQKEALISVYRSYVAATEESAS